MNLNYNALFCLIDGVREMSTVVDVSKALGQYMLKGWILTDNICSNCSRVPLMRSPSSPSSYFCANCDAHPSTTVQATSLLNTPGRSGPAVVGSGIPASVQSSPSLASSSSDSRPSTPPTEVSSVPSSPTFAPPMDTEEILRRRQQSDRASAEIGKRMLRGWAMLADECPGLGCYGIPLVRPPKASADKYPRKECVICGTVYVTEKDAFGQDSLVSLDSNGAPDSAGSGLGQRAPVSQPPASSSSVPSPRKGEGKAAVRIGVPHTLLNDTAPHASQPFHTSSTSSALGASANSLELTLHTLSDRLKALASMPIVEPSLIAQAADAITKVSQALMQVKQLQWSENQAYGA